MSILIGLAHEPVFNAAVATQIVFQQPAKIVAFKQRPTHDQSPEPRRPTESRPIPERTAASG
ncbi:MAG: hypothetical protein DI578_11850 [Ectopseudomonas oleovorans]|nr:MAG: hypothetical protein DI578_11850 [Pseudomonas oleovorans]